MEGVSFLETFRILWLSSWMVLRPHCVLDVSWVTQETRMCCSPGGRAVTRQRWGPVQEEPALWRTLLCARLLLSGAVTPAGRWGGRAAGAWRGALPRAPARGWGWACCPSSCSHSAGPLPGRRLPPSSPGSGCWQCLAVPERAAPAPVTAGRDGGLQGGPSLGFPGSVLCRSPGGPWETVPGRACRARVGGASTATRRRSSCPDAVRSPLGGGWRGPGAPGSAEGSGRPRCTGTGHGGSSRRLLRFAPQQAWGGHSGGSRAREGLPDPGVGAEGVRRMVQTPPLWPT